MTATQWHITLASDLDEKGTPNNRKHQSRPVISLGAMPPPSLNTFRGPHERTLGHSDSREPQTTHANTYPTMRGPEWKAFSPLRVPVFDYDFIRKSLWLKLPMAQRLATVSKALPCAFDGQPGSHVHIHERCQFAVFVHNAVVHTYGHVVNADGHRVNGGRGFLQKQHAALSIVQGVLSWLGLASTWSVRCQWVISKTLVSLHTLVAHWVAEVGY